ncbi:MAG: hypothetical protein BJ554DRAFT_837 [Olpidium bornovanus]|uniref:Uncharacterized protein n=1 Tax=Olpidium bornovanus TaxID=278681 RepID=A0A8H7ZT28_9FUNG|nr:MAG: hypothetical protein BJ554DRAFT_837 [Olpidium bornovanus]
MAASSATDGSDEGARGAKSLAALPQEPDQKTLVENFDYYCLLWKVDPTPKLWAQIPRGTPVTFCERLPLFAAAFAGCIAGGLVLGRYRLGVHPLLAVPLWATSAGSFFGVCSCRNRATS